MFKWVTKERSARVNLAFLLCNILILVGLIAVVFPESMPWSYGGHSLQTQVLSANANQDSWAENTKKPLVAGIPVRIEIEAAEIDLEVGRGEYDARSQKWTLSSDKAYHAVMTAPANNRNGSTFIYGHNRRSVFARLNKLTVGDLAKVHTDNGHTFYYLLRSVQDVEPSDVEVLTYQGPPVLTLQTCSGTWYEDRRLFTFDFIKVEKL